jgi:hypothetical protein
VKIRTHLEILNGFYSVRKDHGKNKSLNVKFLYARTHQPRTYSTTNYNWRRVISIHTVVVKRFRFSNIVWQSFERSNLIALRSLKCLIQQDLDCHLPLCIDYRILSGRGLTVIHWRTFFTLSLAAWFLLSSTLKQRFDCNYGRILTAIFGTVYMIHVRALTVTIVRQVCLLTILNVRNFLKLQGWTGLASHYIRIVLYGVLPVVYGRVFTVIKVFGPFLCLVS